MTAEEKVRYLKKLPEPILTEVYEFAKSLEPQKIPRGAPKKMADIIGLLKDSPHFKGDPVKVVKRIRRECW